MISLAIPADDHGQIRVFAARADLPAEVIEKTPEGLKTLFAADLNPDYVDVLRISDLGDMTLSAYIAEGYDMAPDLVDKAAVDAITGFAILVLSRATGGIAARLTLAEGIRHVTTYSPVAKIVTPETLPHASAKGVIDQNPARAPKSDARIGGIVAVYTLIVMFALVGLMIWVGS